MHISKRFAYVLAKKKPAEFRAMIEMEIREAPIIDGNAPQKLFLRARAGRVEDFGDASVERVNSAER